MKKASSLLLCTLLLFGCAPKVVSHLSSDYPALEPDAEVLVLETDTPNTTVAGVEILGTVSIGDTGFTPTKEGTYEAVLDLAKEQARQAGGNVLRITEHRVPDAMCSTHRIKAEVLRVPDTHQIWTQENTVVSQHPDYAIIYFYRSSGYGALVNYDVYIGETPVFRAKVGTKAEVKVYEAGTLDIWGRTEAKVSLPLTVNLGEEYYVRCSISMGAFIGRPDLQLISRVSGKSAYDAIRPKE